MLNCILQWTGAVFIILGHLLNTLDIDGYNIVAFFLGTIAFLAWSLRVGNRPQLTVNLVAITVCAAGLYRVFVYDSI